MKVEHIADNSFLVTFERDDNVLLNNDAIDSDPRLYRIHPHKFLVHPISDWLIEQTADKQRRYFIYFPEANAYASLRQRTLKNRYAKLFAKPFLIIFEDVETAILFKLRWM